MVATLALRLGIEALAADLVRLRRDRPGAANVGRKVMALVYAIVLGTDSIDDTGVLGAGRTGRLLGGWVPAPSTLGTFLFGRFAARDRSRRGDGRPETFDFLGFTHISAKTRTGRFALKRVTIKKRMRAKLREVKAELRRRMHLPIPEQGKWLGAVVRGHLNYYAVPGNSDAIGAFRDQIIRHWHHALRRRGQRRRINWKQMYRHANRWLPAPSIKHPWPEKRFDAITQGRSPVR